MKKIKLTQGQFALVDDEDFEGLSKFNWYAAKREYTFYAAANMWVDGKRVTVQLHRYILRVTDKSTLVDHKDHNGLNNTRVNLRKCSRSQNGMNRKSGAGSSSMFKGVCWIKKHKVFYAQIRLNSKNKYLGSFTNEEDAAIAYDLAATELFGDFAKLNFINKLTV